jgi:D-arabinose 1-dehydrogenase-like Zn-dependent alcohol dehydrogenase
VLTKEGLFPAITYPRVPGHEVAGTIDEVGPGVKSWSKGDRVGVGWHGGQDGTCIACRRGDFVNCANGLVYGVSYDGGYQEYMIAPVEALARMPDSLDPAEAAPLCAPALQHSTHFVIAERCRATLSQCKESADLVISAFNSQRRAAIASLPWVGVRRMTR